MYGFTMMNRVRNEIIQEKVRVTLVEDKMRKDDLRWFGYVCEKCKRLTVQGQSQPSVRGFGRTPLMEKYTFIHD